MSGIPLGWTQTSLGALCSAPQYGWTTSARKDGGGLRFLRTTDITSGRLDWGNVPYCAEDPPNPEKYALASGDIVISRAGSVGFSYRILDPEPSVFASYLIRFRPSREMDGRYISYFLQTQEYWQQIRSAASGITLANINAKKLAGIQMPLAPRAEQERIVAAIEEQLSRLEVGVDALDRVGQNLKRMRAAVLQAAVTGQLLSPSGSRSEGLPQGWSWQPLEQLITRLRNGIFVSRPVAEPVGPPILRISSVRPMTLDITDVRFVPHPERLKRADDFILEAGDLLFTRYSGNPEYVGACAVVPPAATTLLYPDKLIRVQIDRSLADPRFVAMAASAGRTRQEIRTRVKTTAGQTGISGSDLRTVRFPVPPLEVQIRIIEAVEQSLTRIAASEEDVASNTKHASSLRLSILKEAFSGRLVPQNPSDEPASALLQRIIDKRTSSDGHMKIPIVKYPSAGTKAIP